MKTLLATLALSSAFAANFAFANQNDQTFDRTLSTGSTPDAPCA